MIYLVDLKTGWVGYEAEAQLGAYSIGTPQRGGSLPPLDGGVILKLELDAQKQPVGMLPILLSKALLAQRAQEFLSLYAIYQQKVERKELRAPKGNALYLVECEGLPVTYPRVTSILKQTLSAPALVNWQIKQAVGYTLEHLKRTKRSPDMVMEELERGHLFTIITAGRFGAPKIRQRKILPFLLKLFQRLTAE